MKRPSLQEMLPQGYKSPEDLRKSSYYNMEKLDKIQAIPGNQVQLGLGYSQELNESQIITLETYQDKNVQVDNVEVINQSIKDPPGWPEGKPNRLRNIVILTLTFVGTSLLISKMSILGAIAGILTAIVATGIIFYYGTSTTQQNSILDSIESAGESVGRALGFVAFPIFFPLLLVLVLWIWSRQ